MLLDENILRDYESIQNTIKKHLDRGVNKVIHEENYLTPVVSFKNTPFDDTRGEFKYYSRVREILEIALAIGSIPRKLKLPRGSPEYLSDLVE